jgi:hypothetical protein
MEGSDTVNVTAKELQKILARITKSQETYVAYNFIFM